MRIEETWAYHNAVLTMKRGDPIPVDIEASLMEMGCDVPALKEQHEI